MNKQTAINFAAVFIFLAVFAWVSEMEYQDKLLEEAHTKQVREAHAEKLKESLDHRQKYNELAEEAYLKTNFKGEIK